MNNDTSPLKMVRTSVICELSPVCVEYRVSRPSPHGTCSRRGDSGSPQRTSFHTGSGYTDKEATRTSKRTADLLETKNRGKQLPPRAEGWREVALLGPDHRKDAAAARDAAWGVGGDAYPVFPFPLVSLQGLPLARSEGNLGTQPQAQSIARKV